MQRIEVVQGCALTVRWIPHNEREHPTDAYDIMMAGCDMVWLVSRNELDALADELRVLLDATGDQ